MTVWKRRQCVTCDNVWWPDERQRHAENAAAIVAAPHTIHIWTACQMMSGKRRWSSGQQRKTMSRLSIIWSMGNGCGAWTSHAQASQTTHSGEWHQWSCTRLRP